ncbi:hypothetical protein GCM10027416_11360 [Okibacterium endophyticum]
MKLIAGLVVFAVIFIAGVVVGGSWSNEMAEEKQLEAVRACIEHAGGSIDSAGLDACLASMEG